ncbi:maltose alpha-D-glucosyltransferase [Marinitenerispora sediminis]|uniref:Maltose alpha-D-glucosyltransferase n=1 Tax=Marinitenerispora sediminis TaxID=1931232 RepID=A0A368TBR4_9ACTN|nr:maltose alpha-D-glucosyltransferase [Marinitenerispora sediminis]RCV57957.1 maltose alpha-D-glucosyltransferase [Marinitenerispora sediminis]RCV62310.1 maltose alpha-D-glucosyltransferase [Marinitenerispora sediminis]RCV62558.1 maltose alpha-D-glucosyltransferase [Marinitenerispora sediminis]
MSDVESSPELNGENAAAEITYDEQFYPARPKRLPTARRVARANGTGPRTGEPVGSNPDYVEWLKDRSMLADANVIARQLSGKSTMWQNPFAHPNPRGAIDQAAVWFTSYPLSLMTAPGRSYLATLGDPELWKAFADIGINAVHTGPVKEAGGLDGWSATPSVDGHFDRVGMEIDPLFGTEEEFRRLCATAKWYGGVIIDDLIPGHTGKGADFRLAEMAVGDYPGIYHMIEIAEQDWDLLPEVPPGRTSVNLDPDTEQALEKAGYIIGRLQRVIFYEPGVKETNWSATSAVLGPDGVTRRWVYLHYFKAGQPTVNWIDPSFAGMRLVIGDACHSLADLGSGALRLDANGFLGVEKSAEGLPAWSEGHPLSEAANQFIASIVRKMGGFTFQELNLSLEDIRMTSEVGADLSYDFVNRPAYHHALVTGDTEFLRLTVRLAHEVGVDPVSLVHALQNHDELTHELVHFSGMHANDTFTYHGADVTGHDLAARIQRELTEGLTGERAPYNLPFTANGVACTTVSVVAAALGLRDLSDLSEDEVEAIVRAHLLLAMFNALQPGVFAISGWDLCGTLTLDPAEVAALIEEGDTRWIHRGAHDLMGVNPAATRSENGMPRAVSLYGTLPEQLADPRSFASRLKAVIEVRTRGGIATARQIDVPDVPHEAMLVMVHELPSEDLQVTVLNFSAEPVTGVVRSEHLRPGADVSSMFTGDSVGTVDAQHGFTLALEPFEGTSLIITDPAPGGGAAK